MFTAKLSDDFVKWFSKLKGKDHGAFLYLYNCIRDLELEGHRYSRGKSLKNGLFEIKTHLKYRIYYRFEGDYVIFVISGGDKDSQDRDIRKAKKGK